AGLAIERDPRLAQALAATLQVQQGGAAVERAPAAQVVAAFDPVAGLQRPRGILPLQQQRAHRFAHAAGIDQPTPRTARAGAGADPGFDPADAAVRIAFGDPVDVAAAP